MVAYLSDEWLAEASDALASDAALRERTADVDLTVAYEVSGAPGGKRSYTLRIDHGDVALAPGGDPSAPVSFGLDYDTAAGIARGEVSPQVAFMRGDLKLGGDVTVLLRDGAALDGVTDALGPLRDRTEF